MKLWVMKLWVMKPWVIKLRNFPRALRFTVLALAFALGLTAAVWHPVASQPISPPPTSEIANTSPASLLYEGNQRYEAEDFAGAIALWQQIVSTDQAPLAPAASEPLRDALVWSNLSLAHQRLAQWDAAEAAIARSFAILDSVAEGDGSGGNFEDYWEIRAKALNTQGSLFWEAGAAKRALAVWQASAEAYTQADSLTGVTTAQINQAKAYETLGFTVRAIDTLRAVFHQLENQPDTALKALALRDLGEALRQLGELDEASEILQQGLAIAPAAQLPLHLELGNTYRGLGDRALTIGQEAEANQHYDSAQGHYEAAGTGAAPTLLQAQARISQFSLFLQRGQWAEASSLWPAISEQLDAFPNSRTVALTRLHFAHHLACLLQTATPAIGAISRCHPGRAGLFEDNVQNEAAQSRPTQTNALTWSAIAHQIIPVVQQAQALEDPLLKSYALGQLGELYEQAGQWQEAETLTHRALASLEGQDTPEVAYRWEWQLGRLLQRQGRSKGAIAGYAKAIDSLDSARGNLVLAKTDLQLSFRDAVEPVYREYVGLLLRHAPGADPEQNNLKQAIESIDALQVSELENFLGCRLAQLIQINEASIDPAAIVIYPILLDDRLSIILEAPNQPLVYFETLVSRQTMISTIRALRSSLVDPGQTPEIIELAQQLYGWLITPIEPTLRANDAVQTLVFVLDGSLRNIPMGVLYDGDQYLIEQDYAIAVAPRLNLFRPQPALADLSILAGGVSLRQTIQGTQFPEVEQLQEELAQIPEAFIESPPLVNEAFTKSRIEQQLQTGRYSAIHWKTHGIFSSNPAATYLVAYQDSIQANDLNELVQIALQRRSEPLDLLVLSACETAQGDDRAVLGLAGIAVRAGARTTLSTLWRADDAANTLLMERFYRELLTPNTTKAKALQRAQVALLREYGYPSPYIWATYVLIGSWL
ncbi:MAG: CHAT domain-containing protein [Elainellaceae cyanobacterium]